MMDCEAHGFTEKVHCCEHIRDVAAASSALSVRAFSDRFGDVHFICGGCANPVDAWMESFRSGVVSKKSEPLLSEWATCAGCFEDWCRTAHRKDLKDLLVEATDHRTALDAEARRNKR
jgi:hypothetical protein